ncbi:glycosyltransferase family 4 protein [Elongatibacter sediminis]|uniref:Glycosyltransferase family 4 protein n=1 Tax=Elongatibacter sediminis TaxID=3119006 RepID=A0AAW9REP6_9GAMM
MLRVAFCAYDKPDSIGGPQTWLAHLLPALYEYGIESSCLFLTHWGDTGPCLESLRKHGVDCEQTACQEHTRERIKWILAHLRQKSPDIFVPNLVVAGYFAGRWVRAAGIPTVGVLHSDDPFYRGIRDEFVFGRKAFRVSALACVSRELESQAVALKPRDTMIERIPYGVEVPAKEREKTKGCLRIAYVGRLAEEQKQISQVARSLCRVISEIPGTEAVLYGDGPDRRNVEQVIASMGLELPIRMAGRVPADEIQSHLLDCDVLVLLSDYEGLPIAVLEAMACGVVPVCLRMRSGVPELVEDGVTGLIVDDRGDELVRAIARLQCESGLWQRLSRAAKSRVSSNYSHQACVERWADLFFRIQARVKGKQVISIPSVMVLPRTNPALSSADPRPSPPVLPLRIYRRGRKFAGRIRRRLSGQRIW